MLRSIGLPETNFFLPKPKFKFAALHLQKVGRIWGAGGVTHDYSVDR
jgi:hypothetical protein